MTVYLIGGPPKCGKTMLAKKMSIMLSVAAVSADSLEDKIMARTSKKDFSALFPHAATKGSSNDEFYSQYSTERIVDDYIKQGMATHEVIRNLIEDCIKNRTDIIIEGHQITPKNVRRMIDLHGKEKIRSIFLLKKDKVKIAADFHKSQTPDDWILRKTKNPGTFLKIAQMISAYSKHFESEANTYELNSIQMDEDFDAKINKAIEILTKGDSDSIAVR